MPIDYNIIYEETCAELAELDRKIAELERDRARKREFLLGLGRMLGKEGAPRSKGKYQGQGLQAACELVLRAAYDPLSIGDVYERLQLAGFGFAKQAKPVSTIGITLKRLADTGRAIKQGTDRRPLYTWNWSSEMEGHAGE